MEIRVGPLSVTMHHGESFLVSEPDASIRPGRKQGYFVEDTRLVSRYAVDLCEVAPLLVNSGAIAPHAARYEFVNARMQTPAGPLDPGQLHLRIDRAMGPGLPEDYELTNYSCGPVTLDLTVRIEGDYADLMDVKARTPLRRGTVSSRVEDGGRTRTTRYRNQDFARGLRLEVPQSDTGPEFAEGTLSFRIHLGSHQHWHGCVLWRPILGDELLAAPSPCHQVVTPGNGRGAPDAATRIVTSDPSIDAVLDRSLEDLTALRLHRYDHLAGTDSAHSGVPAAGIPWFVSLFGRDALIVSLQTLPVFPDMAAETLRVLGALQADRYDDRHDAQPGKIEHEWRHGELAHLGLIPQTPYYGAHDPPSLYAMAAAELWRWTGDRETLGALRPYVEAALRWIDTDGDIDGDGLQEYCTRAGDWGYRNQGWKDSGSAIREGDQQLAPPPVATCELQGYTVAAKRSWATVLAECFGERAAARRLRGEAGRLAALIEERFWWEAEGTYYLGLAGADKHPVESVASNPGHLLWCGAIDARRAARVAGRLMAGDMWSGWGVRTLSGDHPAFNPFSYQCGSIWPHDNAIIVAGMLRYGHDEAAWRVLRGLLDAAERFQHRRLPEVFAGLRRDEASFPAQYLGANAPQAWAAGAPLHGLLALLGLVPDALGTTLVVNPRLPPWLGEVHLQHLRLGPAALDLAVRPGEVSVERQEGNTTVCLGGT